AIITFVATGLINLHYRGLLDARMLFANPYGRVFLIKMVPVAMMFAIYFSAPFILKSLSPDSKGACCEIEDGPRPAGRVFAILHLIALGCGAAVVFLGVMLRG
ncbi:MAG: hypothetical protein HZB83_08705, partial [Deltaproteobacteria bacterium]|nr:hypothetical protein [Deltaproteobacteria bacterium]